MSGKRRGALSVWDALPPMAEKELQGQIEQYARLMGWLCYHTRYSLGSVAGFPDLVLVRAERLIFAELKRDGKDPTEAQREWLGALGQVGAAEVYTWRPADWETITQILS